MIEINETNIVKYSKIYDERNRDTENELIEKEVSDWLKTNRFLDKEQFVKIGLWKSRRPKKIYESNDEETVREITQFSFSTKSEKARIECLFVLNGILYPAASAILHFSFPDRYPIIDLRALWAIGWAPPVNYNFEFWQKYCEKINAISRGVSYNIRTVDKALWQYSKIHQNKMAIEHHAG